MCGDRATSGTPARRPTGARARVLVSAAALLHLAIVASIVSQPLDVNARPPEARSLVWRLFNDSVHRRGPAADFFAVYHAGVKVWRGENPYDIREDPLLTPYYFPFRYLPGLAATMGVAFGALQPRAAYLAWVAVLEGLLAGLIIILWRRTPAPWLRVFGALALLLSTPYFLELHMGQFSFATLACLAFALVLVEDDPPPRAPSAWAAAGAFTAAALLKVFPLVTLPAIIRRRAGRICAGLAAVVLAGLDLPAFLGTPGMFRTFVDANVLYASGLHSGNHGLFYLIYMAGRDLGIAWGPGGWTALARVWLVAVLLPTACMVFLSRHPSRATLGGGLLVLAHTLTYVHVWEHHASGVLVVALLMLMALVGAEKASEAGQGTTWTVLLAAASVILLALPTPFALFDRALDVRVSDPSGAWPPAARYLMPLCKTVPMVTLFVLGWKALARSTGRGPA